MRKNRMKKCRFRQEELEHFVYFHPKTPQEQPDGQNVPKTINHPVLTAAISGVVFTGAAVFLKFAYLGLNFFDYVYFLCSAVLMIAGLLIVERTKSAIIRSNGSAYLLVFDLLLTIGVHTLFWVVLPYFQITGLGWLLAIIAIIEIISPIALIRSRMTSDWYGRKKQSHSGITGIAASFAGSLLFLALIRNADDAHFFLFAFIAAWIFFLGIPICTTAFARLYYYYRYLKTTDSTETESDKED